MPMMKEVRRLGPGWQTLQDRVAAYAAAMPKDGVTLATFEADCLSAIFLPDRPGIVRALKSKRLIFPVRTGPSVRIFGEKQAGASVRVAGDPAVDQFIRGVSARMMRLAEVVEGDGDANDREHRSELAEAVRQVVVLARRHIGEGLALADARDALWRTFNAEAVKALASRESVFARDSLAKTIAPRKAKPLKAPAHQPLIDRVAFLVMKAGALGVSKTDIRRALPSPRPPFAEIDVTIAELEGLGVINTATGKVGTAGVEGLRVFHSSARIPPKVNGRFLFPRE